MEIPHGWSKKDNCIFLAIKCNDFKHAIALLNSIGDIAEKLNHHPDLGIRNYNEVFVSSTTHEEDKVTEKDIELAEEITDLINHQDNIKQIEQFGRYIA
ncbi:4a-hydroxytetrahydrobiopterin dehydratase [Candidatus Nomurabacteria bacterium]|nr:4a-hydroxytetrahydrobiopterin dehydratase [Candidatus Saccharibacteria bacterium]MCA9313308.1 4a-hydroxytetrahydrobiopterin dehydratase [Candidatus Saccharibacteria bacterium]MCB9821794.1 4a-hydroxytetrahydrobiopterin dehydratase [Candidatus Nomurabacteria bacterium]